MHSPASDKPIVVAGFGRSGTTWLADIIAKSLGGLMLFEPFHPQVCPFAKEFAYSVHYTGREQEFIKNILADPPRDAWLLRNVLSEPIQSTPRSTLEDILKHTQIIGYKSVRALHCFDQMSDIQAVFIYRHPLAVIASIDKRTNYWLEFGWEWHRSHYLDRALASGHLTEETKRVATGMAPTLRSTHEWIALMWTISLVIGYKSAKDGSHPVVSYESLYLNPLDGSRRLLAELGYSKVKLHPSYIFTPSMTTMKTVHLTQDTAHMNRETLNTLFWRGSFSESERDQLIQIIKNVLSTEPKILQLCDQEEYL